MKWPNRANSVDAKKRAADLAVRAKKQEVMIGEIESDIFEICL